MANGCVVTPRSLPPADARMALADAHLAVKHAGSCTAILGVMSPDDGCLKVRASAYAAGLST